MIWDALREDFERADREEAAKRGVSVDQLKKERAERDERQNEAYFEQQEQERLQLQKERAEYGSQIGLGVPAQPGHSIVMRGLYESRGDGSDKRTVSHILLFDKFSHGRIQRDAWQFLCRKDVGREGAGEMDFSAKITCPKCADLLGRIQAEKVEMQSKIEAHAERSEEVQSRGMEMSR